MYHESWHGTPYRKKQVPPIFNRNGLSKSTTIVTPSIFWSHPNFASSHKTKRTQQWLEDNLSDFLFDLATGLHCHWISTY
jgi:hypothetical protein